MATPLPLEGDGLVENLFYFLWSKDDFGAGPRIFVPHTVLFRFAQPAAWYFTSLRSNKIKKKAKVNLTNAQIEHEFTKKRGASDIVACYLYFASHASSNGNHPESSSSTVIEYFDAEALRDFLYHRDKSANGMLQKFVLPKGTSNATVRAIWSPKICLLERRVNLRNVHDKRFSVYERGVTFDGADLHSRPEPVRGAMLPGEVQLLCEQVVDHVTQVSYHKYRIARMVLHLKADADDRLWLLWCSSLRLLNLSASESGALRPLDIVNDAQVPEFARLPFGLSSTVAGVGSATGADAGATSHHHHHHHHRDHDDKRMGFARCMSCGELKEHKKLLATTYKAVLDHFQRFMRFLRLQVNEGAHAAIEWPPDERFVQAAGGVGFGILQCFEKGSFSGSGSSAAKKASGGGAGGSASSLTRKELVIPPVIQYLHPSFSVDDFERHRHDPLFLHKPVAVCESCCLVYSDYTTSSLEVNSIRQTAPAILRPHCELSDAKKRLDPLDPLAAALATSHSKLSPPASGARSLKKPPASAWKPVAETKKPPRARGPQSGLSSLPAVPQLPQRIDSFGELLTTELAGSGGSALGSSQSASALLQQREETFFRELHQQKDLERGHPLHHMLESATRLAASKKRQQEKATLRLSNGNAAEAFGRSRSVGMLPEVLEQQLASKKANEGSPVKLAKDTKKKAKKRAGGAKKKSRREENDGGNEDEQQPNVGANAAARFVSAREKKASEEHQDFLFAALSQAEAQLENIESLACLLPETSDSGHTAAGHRGCGSESDADDDGSEEGEEDHDGEGESEEEASRLDGEDEDEHTEELVQDSNDRLNATGAACEDDREDGHEDDRQSNRVADEAEEDGDVEPDAGEHLSDVGAANDGDSECQGEGDSPRNRDEGEQNEALQRDPDDHLDGDRETSDCEAEGLIREQTQDEDEDDSSEQRDAEEHLDTEAATASEDVHGDELQGGQEQHQDEDDEHNDGLDDVSGQPPLKDDEAPTQGNDNASDAQ